MDGREAKIQEVVQQLEIDLEFLSVTGVEDMLQVDVMTTI